MTGGPELAHQLADVLNRDFRRAWMLYLPVNEQHAIPEVYLRYNVGSARLEDVEPGSIVIVPEIYPQLIRKFPKAEIYFWWLSVDNFFAHAGYTIPGRVIGAQRVAKIQLGRLRTTVDRHLYQSDYAREFLESVALGPSDRVSDYLAAEYVQAIATPPTTQRQNILAYNPAKGIERTELILRALRASGRPMPEIIPISEMSRDQICDLFARAKVYIDFGGHPGKDRLPREAAAFGACVVANRRGSASNATDMPIPEDLKIDDRMPGFEKLAADRIHLLMDDFRRQAGRFDDYRQSIAREPAAFLNDVRSAFPADL